VKRPKRAELDRELAKELADKCSPELLKAVVAAPLHAKKIQKQKKYSNLKQPSVADRVYDELEHPTSFALVEARRQLGLMILEPVPKVAWTKELDGYKDARISAENAIRRIWAATDAAQAGLEGDPWLGVCLHKVRAGLLAADSPELLRYIEHAQKIGKAEWFIERVTADLENAKKRVPSAPQFNQFRALLVVHWMRYLFWLMSDDLIARVVTTIKLKPDGCNRQTITRAVKELRLVKHPDTGCQPVVKALGEGGVFIFREGYSPQF